MIYEYRVYEAMPGKGQALVQLMGKTAPIFEKVGMKALGYWTPAVGEPSNRFIYILAFDNMAHREKAWAAFLADPDWKKLAPEWSKDGPVMSKSFNSFLTPTPYSPAK